MESLTILSLALQEASHSESTTEATGQLQQHLQTATASLPEIFIYIGVHKNYSVKHCQSWRHLPVNSDILTIQDNRASQAFNLSYYFHMLTIVKADQKVFLCE